MKASNDHPRSFHLIKTIGHAARRLQAEVRNSPARLTGQKQPCACRAGPGMERARDPYRARRLQPRLGGEFPALEQHQATARKSSSTAFGRRQNRGPGLAKPAPAK